MSSLSRQVASSQQVSPTGHGLSSSLRRTRSDDAAGAGHRRFSRRTPGRCSAWFVALAASWLLVGAPSAAHAQTVDAKVLIVLAKEEPGTIDAALADVAALRRPPFNSFRSMSLLSRPALSLRVREPSELALPNGRKLRIVLEQVLPDGRYRVRVSINRPEQNDYLPLLQVVASPGDPFFVAGQSHQGGTLVVGITIGARPS